MAARPIAAPAEWSITTRGTLFYTDDVAIFSATRRLSPNGDPTQPALDTRLTGQGSDGVFEPSLALADSFTSSAGTTTLELYGDGFVFFDHTQYSNGSFSAKATQAFTSKTKLVLRYYLNPNLYLGENEEHQSGVSLTAPEELSSNIGSLRLDQEVIENVELRFLTRYGSRRYNQPFQERDLNFWTLGSHVNWRVIPAVRLGLAYHFERGMAVGHSQAEFEDDVSYVNNYGSVDLDAELSEDLSLTLAVHYEYNDWLSPFAGDERYASYETVIQGEALLRYRLSTASSVFLGVQHSNRKESNEAFGIGNTNVGLGVETRF